MCVQDTARIPLSSKGTEGAAYTVVDTADAPWVGQRRWSLTANGLYAFRRGIVNGRTGTMYLHRELLGLQRGDGLEVDHINRNGLDNRRSNLRIVTRAGNTQNTAGMPNKTSRHRGVHWDRRTGKWRAEVGMNGKHIKLGRFAREEDAAEAARSARLRLLPYATD